MTEDRFEVRDTAPGGQTGPHDEGALQQEGPVVRDRRRLDPETGKVRQQPADTSTAQASGPEGENRGDGPDTTTEQVSDEVMEDVGTARDLAEELRTDLQRLQAEYVNYRRRVDRDRDVARETGAATVLEALVPVLDDIHYAREHGDLAEGPFVAIADKLEAVLAKFGFERYGDVGEPFDPVVHEALMHSHSADVTETTVVQVLQPGYRQGARILRAARVAVADPE